jgi:propanol-preferring alcohol dehydrogenase
MPRCYIYSPLTHSPKFHKPYQIRSVPVPDPSALHPHALLVKVAAASYCHTDHMVRSGIFASPLPITASHEGAATRFQPGDRVLSGLQRNRYYVCKECTDDPLNTQFYSRSDGAIGIKGDGAFTEYMVIDGREAGRVPPGLPFAAAAPLACAA